MTNGTTNDVRATLEALAWRLNWGKEELEHAIDAHGAQYEDETVLRLCNGRQIRCPAFPAECVYVRVTEAGHELGYWTFDEWRDDPAAVLGAALGCAAGPRGGEAALQAGAESPGAWFGKLRTRTGELEFDTPVLVVASGQDQAAALLERAAAEFYGDGDEPCVDGGYYANDGQIFTSALSLTPLDATSFAALKRLGFMLKREPDVFLWLEDAERQADSLVGELKQEGLDYTHLEEEVLEVATRRGADVLNGDIGGRVRYLLSAGYSALDIIDEARQARNANEH